MIYAVISLYILFALFIMAENIIATRTERRKIKEREELLQKEHVAWMKAITRVNKAMNDILSSKNDHKLPIKEKGK